MFFEGDLGKNQPKVFNKILRFQNIVKNRRFIFSQNHPKNMWLLVKSHGTVPHLKFSTNAIPILKMTCFLFRLISSRSGWFQASGWFPREKPDVYKETSRLISHNHVINSLIRSMIDVLASTHGPKYIRCAICKHPQTVVS